jgi:hypothetical protein
MKISKYILSLMSIFLMAGCATRGVETSVTTFHGGQHEQRGVIAVLPIDGSQTNSLEFNAVSNYLLKKFESVGYVSDEKTKTAEYFAYITYGIDNGKTTSSTVPIFGQTGGGTSFSSGTVNSGNRFGSYSGTTTTMPTYGMIGAVPVDTTVFKRVVNIDVYKKETQIQKKYELRGVSVGTCGNINVVLYNIIDGMFTNFPGVNGQTKVVEIPLNGKC